MCNKRTLFLDKSLTKEIKGRENGLGWGRRRKGFFFRGKEEKGTHDIRQTEAS